MTDLDRLIAAAHSTQELLLRQRMTPDIEESIKLQDDIILLAHDLRKLLPDDFEESYIGY